MKDTKPILTQSENISSAATPNSDTSRWRLFVHTNTFEDKQTPSPIKNVWNKSSANRGRSTTSVLKYNLLFDHILVRSYITKEDSTIVVLSSFYFGLKQNVNNMSQISPFILNQMWSSNWLYFGILIRNACCSGVCLFMWENGVTLTDVKVKCSDAKTFLYLVC